MGLLDILRGVAREADEEVDVHDGSVDVKGKGYVFRYGTNDAALSRAILDSQEAARSKKRGKRKEEEE